MHKIWYACVLKTLILVDVIILLRANFFTFRYVFGREPKRNVCSRFGLERLGRRGVADSSNFIGGNAGSDLGLSYDIPKSDTWAAF